MKKYKINYPDGSAKEINAVLHKGFLCRQTVVQNGWRFVKKRTNYDPWDDDEPEYETKRVRNYDTEHIPFLNRAALEKAGRFGEAQRVAKTAQRFHQYKDLQPFFFTVGENACGIVIGEI